uniref:Protein inscuteable homologue C-terminal domain-containing protein n=1 Tax=Trichogramma kaykai TaxID=54128 RepID=A0ABD2XM15_9HYME
MQAGLLHTYGSSHNRDDTSPRESLRDFLYGDDRMFNNEQIQHHKSSSSPSPVSSYCDDDDDDFEEDDDAEREAISRSPAQVWLTELRDDCEDECQATLQSKSLPKRSRARYPCEAADAHDLRLLTASATTAAKKIVDAAGRFDRSYHKLTQSMLAATSSKSKQLRDSLGRFEAEASDILVKLGSTLPRRLASHEDQPRTMALQLAKLKNHVDRALDRRLDFYIEKVVRGLEEAPRQTGSTARGALAALTALALAGPRAAASIARCAGVRALLLSLVSAGRLSTDLRCACLRALACVCSCLEAVDQFVAEAGPEILVDLLAAPETPEAEKSEAAALVVQLTAPWIERMGLPHLEAYCERLVEALTELAEATHDKQTLLLAAAAINHLSHSRHSIRHIVERDSIKKLLRLVQVLLDEDRSDSLLPLLTFERVAIELTNRFQMREEVPGRQRLADGAGRGVGGPGGPCAPGARPPGQDPRLGGAGLLSAHAAARPRGRVSPTGGHGERGPHSALRRSGNSRAGRRHWGRQLPARGAAVVAVAAVASEQSSSAAELREHQESAESQKNSGSAHR